MFCVSLTSYGFIFMHVSFCLLMNSYLQMMLFNLSSEIVMHLPCQLTKMQEKFIFILKSF
jgi:hypothetical protein